MIRIRVAENAGIRETHHGIPVVFDERHISMAYDAKSVPRRWTFVDVNLI